MKYNEGIFNTNVRFYIQKKMMGNHLLHFAYKDNIPLKYSSDFFHIRNSSIVDVENTLLQFRYISKNQEPTEIISETVMSFVTSFSRGTVHGYSAVWELIIKYLENNLSCKVLIYESTQQGIIDLIYKVIGKDKVIFIKANTLYLLKSAIFYPLEEMHFTDTFWDNKVEPLFKKYILDSDVDIKGSDMAIIKSSNSDNRTNTGNVSLDLITTVCNNNNFTFIEPANNNECYTANVLWRATRFLTSWGTSYYKNIRYIGDNCKEIYVLVFPDFFQQYNARKNIPNSHTYKKYKNATVKYIITSPIALNRLRLEKI